MSAGERLAQLLRLIKIRTKTHNEMALSRRQFLQETQQNVAKSRKARSEAKQTEVATRRAA